MRILALDLATVTGFCIGEAGQKPVRVGAARMKRSDEDHGVAGKNIGCLIRDIASMDWPDMVVIEAAMHAAAKDEKGNGGFSIELAWALVGSVYGFCGPQGIPVREANVQTVRKHFTGRARWGGRDAAKSAVVGRCHLLGLLPKSDRNDNKADAIAVWDWACATFARRAASSSSLHLFGETA